MIATIRGYWQGMVPPQYIFCHRRFKAIALDSPDLNPGSWVGWVIVSSKLKLESFFSKLGSERQTTTREALPPTHIDRGKANSSSR